VDILRVACRDRGFAISEELASALAACAHWKPAAASVEDTSCVLLYEWHCDRTAVVALACLVELHLLHGSYGGPVEQEVEAVFGGWIAACGQCLGFMYAGCLLGASLVPAWCQLGD
jgi:hypothetical protein